MTTSDNLKTITQWELARRTQSEGVMLVLYHLPDGKYEINAYIENECCPNSLMFDSEAEGRTIVEFCFSSEYCGEMTPEEVADGVKRAGDPPPGEQAATVVTVWSLTGGGPCDCPKCRKEREADQPEVMH